MASGGQVTWSLAGAASTPRDCGGGGSGGAAGAIGGGGFGGTRLDDALKVHPTNHKMNQQDTNHCITYHKNWMQQYQYSSGWHWEACAAKAQHVGDLRPNGHDASNPEAKVVRLGLQ